MSTTARRRLAMAWLDLGPAWSARDGWWPTPTPVTEAQTPGEEGAAEVEAAAVAASGTTYSATSSATPSATPSAALQADSRAVPQPASRATAQADLDEAKDFAPDAITEVSLDPDTAATRWARLQAAVKDCTACDLAATRRQTVFGVGAPTASVMIIGEAPGAEEDARGEPFVGQAGRLLDLMLAEIGLARGEQVFICNVLKCRPPNNRNPQPDEVAACAAFLEEQIKLVRPRVVLLLGGFAIRSILKTESSVGSQRGTVHRRVLGGVEVPIIVSYHPAYLLRNPADKRKSWEDLLRLAEVLDEAGPAGDR